MSASSSSTGPEQAAGERGRALHVGVDQEVHVRVGARRRAGRDGPALAPVHREAQHLRARGPARRPSVASVDPSSTRGRGRRRAAPAARAPCGRRCRRGCTPGRGRRRSCSSSPRRRCTPRYRPQPHDSRPPRAQARAVPPAARVDRARRPPTAASAAQPGRDPRRGRAPARHQPAGPGGRGRARTRSSSRASRLRRGPTRARRRGRLRRPRPTRPPWRRSPPRWRRG